GAADVAAKGTVIPIRIVGNRPRATVRVLVAGEEHVGDAMVDTGATTTSLAAAFRREHPFDVRTTPKVVVGGGVGGFIEGRYFRPDAVMLGPLEFRRPILSMVEAEEGISDEKDPIDVLLASDLLRRSRVTFDYARFRMTLEPNTDFAAPFEADKSGLQIQARAGEAKAFEIVGVLPGSAADEAGVRVGDVLESVDGAPVSSFTLTRLRDAFRSATSTKWELGLRRGEKRIRVTVPAKSVI
ncbi:MAG TPA: PDZ domain-containing protein, partial [Planctomycetota bacterium]|nr:PDZ domain-containing protein [Planctomycetota bacterium]